MRKQIIAAFLAAFTGLAAHSQAATLNLALGYDKDAGERPSTTALAFDANIEHPQPMDYKFGRYDGEGGYTFNLPEGTYNLYVKCSSPRGWKVVAREGVAVSGNTALSLSTAEAVNHITFKSLMTDGTPVCDEKIEEGAWLVDLKICYNRRLIEAIGTNSYGYAMDDGTMTSIADSDYSVWVSPNSTLSFGRIDMFASKDGISYVRHYSKNSDSGQLVNDPADYVTVTERYTPTPWFQNQIVDPEEGSFEVKDCIGFSYMAMENGICVGQRNLAIIEAKSDNVPETILNICAMPADDGDPLDIYPAFHYAENSNFGLIQGLPIRVERDKSYMKLGFVGSADITVANSDEAGMMSAIPDPRFSYAGDCGMSYGGSCPITNFQFKPVSRRQPEFDYDFVGRLNEVRGADKNGANVTFRSGDKVLLDGNGNGSFARFSEEMMNLFFSWWDTPAEEGRYTVDIVNRNHVTAEGLPGANETHVEFDTRLDDFEAPVLRGLVIRDADDAAEQSFETVADAARGCIELAVADVTRNETGYYSYGQPVPTVEVEYAPYGTDDFAPLAVEEKADWANIPGFGHHFAGNLPEVSTGALYGWYDVRITLTDDAGNLQRQLVSPAFQVRAMASAATPKIDGTPTVVGVYNLQGIPVDGATWHGACIEVMSDGSSRKVLKR